MKAWLIVLPLGLAGGAAGGYFGRPAVDRAMGGVGQIEAQVVSERRDDDRLVLTLRSGDDTMLATFRNRVDDIAELVTPGDTITLRTRATTVFADDVPIVRVAHPAMAADAEPAADAEEHAHERGHVAEHEDEDEHEDGAEPEHEDVDEAVPDETLETGRLARAPSEDAHGAAEPRTF